MAAAVSVLSGLVAQLPGLLARFAILGEQATTTELGDDSVLVQDSADTHCVTWDSELLPSDGRVASSLFWRAVLQPYSPADNASLQDSVEGPDCCE